MNRVSFSEFDAILCPRFALVKETAVFFLHLRIPEARIQTWFFPYAVPFFPLTVYS